MVHDARGWWIAEAGPPPLLPALAGDLEADVVVIGGGYTGMWAAWHVLDDDPDARVVVLEDDRCGFGPSGRNGGFVQSFGVSVSALRKRYGGPAAEALIAASEDSVRAIGAWCAAQRVDAWYRAAPHLVVSAAPVQDGVGRAAVDGERVVALSGEEVRARCASPLFRRGVEVTVGATVQPARLAFGLRERLRERGVRIFERSRVAALEGATARTGGGSVRARAAIVAAGAASGAVPPLRDRLTVSSSHIVLTEPVPDVVEALGWTGGEAISDGRTLLHYLRTTPDGRIAFGWAGGRMAAGARTGARMEVDAEVVARVRADLVRFFPVLAGRAVEHAWGGPIDVSPTHLPFVVALPGGRAHAACGFTGNGVGPSHLAGRALAALALGRRDEVAALPIVGSPLRRVPPEPLRVAGAALIRRALVAKEATEQDGARPGPMTRAVAALPARLGLHIVR
ncbi:MAG TPA: FAD-dependent oxidoreductase [Solirubrobacteraceae bacterium]|nr:FAD-dependent oxidoreductase [Solirubrobacteraceae bacterium]